MKTIVLTMILTSLLSITNISAITSKNIIYNNIEVTENGCKKEYIIYDEKASKIVSKITYQYDPKGYIQKRTFYKSDYDCGWKAVQKYEYTYNDAKHINYVTHTKWDKKSKNWATKSERLNHIYNNEGKLIAVNKIEINDNSELIHLK